jgi:hypothetical protein
MHATDADYIGISQTGRLVAVDQTVTAISHLVELESMSRDRIRGTFPPRDRQQHAKHSQESRRALRGSGPGLNARNVGSTVDRKCSNATLLRRATLRCVLRRPY